MLSFVEIGSVILENKIFKFRLCILLSSLGLRIGPSFGQTSISFTQGSIVPFLFKIGPMGLKKKISQFYRCILTICYHLRIPFEKSGVLFLTILHFHASKDILCQVWLKLAQWLWRRRFLKIVNVFSLFCYYFPSIEQT